MKNFLYSDLAGRIEQLIVNRTIKAGDKLPSVRTTSKEQGVSISTVLKAYAYLENLGLVESRPKSGYYVRLSPDRQYALPQRSNPDRELQLENLDDLRRTVVDSLHDPTVIPFSMGMPSVEFLPVAKFKKAITQVVRKYPDACLSYHNVQGSKRLRQQIAILAFNHGTTITEEEIICTTGCMEALNLAIRSCTQPGDPIAIESPTFFGIIQAITAAGRQAVEISTHPIYGADLEALEEAIRNHQVKACLFVTNFSNPMGALVPAGKKKKLMTLLSRYDLPLIENDMNGELYYTPKRPHTCKSIDPEGRVLLCSSVSKTLVPGYRVGWIIPGRYYAAAFRAKMANTISSSTLAEEAVAHFLANNRYELHMRKMRKALFVESLKYLDAIGRYFPPDTKISRPQGGLVFWIELGRHVNTLEIFKQSSKMGISIAPGQLFSRQSDFNHCFRLCFGLPFTDEIDGALRKLGQIIDQYRTI